LESYKKSIFVMTLCDYGVTTDYKRSSQENRFLL